MYLPRCPVQCSFRRAVFNSSLRKLDGKAVKTGSGGADRYEARRGALLEKAVHRLE